MNYLKLLFFVLFANCLSVSIAQSSRRVESKNFNHYSLYSSSHRVYYKDGNNWKPVLYDETILKNETVVKAELPFTVFNGNQIFTCKPSKDGDTLGDLIYNVKSRKSTIEKTFVFHKLIDFPDSLYNKNAYNINYLLIEVNNWREKLYTFSPDLKQLSCCFNELINSDFKSLLHNYEEGWDDDIYSNSEIKCVLGYNNLLTDVKETTKKSIVDNLRILFDTKKTDKVMIYISCDGITDSDGKFHFVTSDAEYDSLNCNYINTISADSLFSSIKVLKPKGTEVYVFINTKNSETLIENIFDMDNKCAYIWNPYNIFKIKTKLDDNSTFVISMLQNIFNYENPIYKVDCDTRYFIREQK